MPEEKKPKATLPRAVVDTVPSSIKVAKLLDQLTALLPAVQQEADVAIMNGALGAARAFVVLHRLNSKLDDFCKAYSAYYDECKKEKLPHAIETSGQKFIALVEGYRVGISYRTLASIKEGMRDMAFQWLRKNKLGDLIISTVNASTLSAAAKHMKEEANQDLPDDLFNVADVPNASVTATK